MLDVAPYQQFSLETDESKDNLLRVQFYFGPLDTYCVECKKECPFTLTTPCLREAGVNDDRPIPVEFVLDGRCNATGGYGLGYFNGSLTKKHLRDGVVRNRWFLVEFACTRNATHTIRYFFNVNNGAVEKVGQVPSISSMAIPEAHKYRKALGDARYMEFTKALGLYSHDVGIGAFVYLRRVFESLIEKARTQATKDNTWDEAKFRTLRMEEKIKTLERHLPMFLVENRAIYSILSLGIHELTEDQCLSYFEPLRESIELILDEILSKEEQDKKIERTRKAIQSITKESTSSS